MGTPVDYKSTLNLPKTDFPMKADLPKREVEMLAHWDTARLYEAVQQARKDAPRFLLHDGPPYANGDIHIGHALNKILKDIIVRYQTMRGFASPYVPGWDCHGMPIEHQLFKERRLTKQQISQTEFRRLARDYAQHYVDVQREQFKRLAVLGDWDHPYLTMAKEYELTILRTFKELVKAGYIYHGKKPVYWCATCETALAEAEVEYEDRDDPSVFVKFPVDVQASPEGIAKTFQKPTAVAIWTTTPWTLPANVALCFHPSENYFVLRAQGEEYDLIVAEKRADQLPVSLEFPKVPNLRPGADFEGMLCKVPFGNRHSVVVTDETVSMAEGTGIVHIAPGHGQEDYRIGQRYKLDVLSPVDHQGKFTDEAKAFAGQSVFAANQKIIADLDRRGLLLSPATLLPHSYPHCWRCKQPVIFRATPQWFLSVEHQGLRQRLLDAARQVTWIPGVGLNRITGMLENRPDWCLSRQRYWGTPIPILHCQTCDKPILAVSIIERLERLLGERGTDFWFTAETKELLPDGCPTCRTKELRKETDILDVWFDSGVSHEAVLKSRAELAWPADLYLEGSDQHRGWFQVSLIPSVALHGKSPYRQVLTHGFVVDGEGRKMSKSLGNVIAPQEITQRYGAEVLRLWVASSDYAEDVRISEAILERTAEAYRKIRNTFRYLLANVYDFHPAQHAKPTASFPELDRWALQRTQQILDEVTQAYDSYQFHQAFRAMYQYCVLDLSAFYLDALKDRLYTEAADSVPRRCAQTVLYGILKSLVKMTAPLLPITAEEVWQGMRTLKLVDETSVHLALWPAPLVERLDEELGQRWKEFLAIRDVAMKALEEQRSQGVIGSPLEAEVTLQVPESRLGRLCEAHRDTLAEAWVVSSVRVVQEAESLEHPDGSSSDVVPGVRGVRVERAPGSKCQRCWKYRVSVGSHPAHPQLCERCVKVVEQVS